MFLNSDVRSCVYGECYSRHFLLHYIVYGTIFRFFFLLEVASTLFFNTLIYYSRVEKKEHMTREDILKIVIMYQKVYKYFDFFFVVVIVVDVCACISYLPSEMKSSFCNCWKMWNMFASLPLLQIANFSIHLERKMD